MARIHRLGQVGEELATQYLTQQGWEILDRNFRRKGAELDIVARDPARGTVFVEVKTRGPNTAITAWESITEAKMNYLRRGAAAWLAENQDSASSVHLDAIVVKIRGTTATIEHRRSVV